jgi:hypothetical protein
MITGVHTVISIALGILVDVTCFYLLFLSLFFSLLSFLFLINRIYVEDDTIRVSCIRIKTTFQKTDLKEIFIERIGRMAAPQFMVLCFNDYSDADDVFLLHQYHNRCKHNPSIKLVQLEYNEKLFEELTRDGDIKILPRN